MEEGWTVRPESPSLSDGEQIQDPFVIEVNPLQLVSTWHEIEMKSGATVMRRKIEKRPTATRTLKKKN